MTPDLWQDYFQPGETLLWEGAPSPGVHQRAKIIGLAIFGLPFLTIGIATFASGLSMLFTAKTWADAGLGFFLATFAVPFAGIGALMVVGQWWAAARAHRTTRYALSNRAAYIAKSLWRKSIEVYPILRSTPSGLEKGKTSDTVWFNATSTKDSDGDRSTTRVAFDNIADGDAVFRLIRSIQMGTP